MDFPRIDCRIQNLTCWASIPSKESIMGEVLVSSPRELHLANPYYTSIIPSRPKVLRFYKRSLESSIQLENISIMMKARWVITYPRESNIGVVFVSSLMRNTPCRTILHNRHLNHMVLLKLRYKAYITKCQ